MGKLRTLTTEEKLIAAQMVLDGCTIANIDFFGLIFKTMRANDGILSLSDLSVLACMTRRGCHKHLYELRDKGYVERVSHSEWMLVEPILKDKDLSVCNRLYDIYER